MGGPVSPQFWPPPGDDSGWVTPTLASGWATPAGNFAPVRYRKVDGIVEMQGAAAGATSGDPIFTLPTGFRPDIPAGKEALFGVNNGTAGATVTRVVIRANGQVVAIAGTTPTFDAIRFRAAL